MSETIPKDPSLIAALESRVALLRESVREVEAEAESLRVRLERYEEILKFERALAGVARDADRVAAIGDAGNVGQTDRWRVFEEFIAKHEHDGFVRPDIGVYMRQRGVEVGKNFPYYAVDKYEGSGKLTLREGRYFPI